VTPKSLRSGARGSRGHPPNPPLGQHCARVLAAPARSLTPGVATNTVWVSQRTQLAATTSIWSSSSSATEDSDTTKEDVLSALSNTKSQTQVAKLHRASNSMSASHRAPCSALSYLVASSSQLTIRARLKGGPRNRSQTLMSGLSRREHCSSCFRNLATISSTTSTRKASVGERLSMNSMCRRHRRPERGKLLSHLNLMEGSDSHSI
jgi:hypothetical protein